jgi:RinA family phage transcriptional activator
MRIPPAVWRYIEYELYSYEQTKKDLEELRESIIESTPYSDIHVQSGPGNPTEKKGLKLISSPAIIHLDRTVAAIEKTLNQLTEEHNQLFNLKYCQGKNWRVVCEEMPTSERTYFRLRREIVMLTAEKLGMAETWQE